MSKEQCDVAPENLYPMVTITIIPASRTVLRNGVPLTSTAGYIYALKARFKHVIPSISQCHLHGRPTRSRQRRNDSVFALPSKKLRAHAGIYSGGR